MGRVFTAELAELLEFQLVSGLLLVLGRRIILTLALSAIQSNDHAHDLLPYITVIPASWI